MSLIKSDPEAMQRVTDCMMRIWYELLDEARRAIDSTAVDGLRLPLVWTLEGLADKRDVDFYEVFDQVVNEYCRLGYSIPSEMHDLVEELAWDIEHDGKVTSGTRAYVTYKGIEILPVRPRRVYRLPDGRSYPEPR